jgi:hypothetical protein
MIAVLEGLTAAGDVGFYPIASIVGSPVTQIVLSGTLTNQVAAAGTCKIYYAHTTIHGAGTEAHITTLSQLLRYTPSPEDTLLTTPILNDWAEFVLAKNGYYSKFTGYTDYRILGIMIPNASGNATAPISYKSGRNKNDNVFASDTFAAWGGTDTKIAKFTNFTKMKGNDYTVINTAANGTYLLANREIHGFFEVSICSPVNPAAGDGLGLSLNSPNLTTSVISETISNLLNYDLILSIAATMQFAISGNAKMIKGDIVRPHGTGLTPYLTNGLFRASFEV